MSNDGLYEALLALIAQNSDANRFLASLPMEQRIAALAKRYGVPDGPDLQERVTAEIQNQIAYWRRQIEMRPRIIANHEHDMPTWRL